MKYVVLEEKIEARGASKALNKTMEDIDRMIEGIPLDKARPLRKKLRHKIRRAFHQFDEHYYVLGYKRGVYTAYDMLSKRGKISGIVKKVMRVRFLPSDPNFGKPKTVILKAYPEKRRT
jgi:hypothetical protein